MSRTSDPSSALLRWSVFFFFFSGATGLVYQVLWTRRLTLVFGHTVLAVSTVLTAFMAGLALGSLAAGYWTDGRRGERPVTRFLSDYGYLEGFIGLWALLSLPLLYLVERLYFHLAASGTSGTLLHLSCFLAAAFVLVPPTTAMGATVPILSRLLVQQKTDVGGILSQLYGLNTLGALAGAFLGGFFLLPTLGLTVSMVLAATVNFAIAFGAIYKSREIAMGGGAGASKKKTAVVSTPEVEGTVLWTVPLSFALAGAASMAYQVSWNRTICLAIGSSIYAFSTILVMFLAGLGLGSLLYPRLMNRRVPRLSHLALLYLSIGVTGIFTVILIPWLPIAFFHLFPFAGGQFWGILLINFLLVGVMLFPPTLCMGLGFPLATAIYSQSLARLGRSVGTVYGANTVGCIVGAFFTGFVFVPNLGAQWTLQLASLCYLLTAMGLGLATGSRVFRFGVATACLTISVITVFLPRWETGVMSSGMAVYSGARNLRLQPPAVYMDGFSSVVSFHLEGEFWEIPSMRVNGKVDASRSLGDRLTQHMLGYLPTLLHQAPKRVGIIGLGGGFTVEAVAECPGVESIEVAELEPAVVKVGEYWKPFNSRVLEDPRVKVHIQDGRTFVLASEEPFDVIISEPSNPWIAGIGNLFTRDFYLGARSRLKYDGIMCQWFNLYAVSESDMKMVVRGFYDVFPHGHLWQSSGGDLLILGSQAPMPLGLGGVLEAWQGSPEIQRHFFEGRVYHPNSFAGNYLMSREDALEMVGEGPINTDDRPLLEFSAPFSLYTVRDVQFFSEIAPKSDFPPGFEVPADFKRWSLFGLLNRDNYIQLRSELAKVPKEHPDVLVLEALLELTQGEKQLDKARALFATCLKKFPRESGLAAATWAGIEYDRQQFAAAAQLYQTALNNPPPGSQGHLHHMLGQSYFNLGDYARAVPHLFESGKIFTTQSTGLSLTGAALLGLKDYEAAEEILHVALKRNPHDPLALKSMGSAQFHRGKSRAAAEYLVRFLALCPGYPAIWVQLATSRQAYGDEKGAQEAAAQALLLAPGDPSILANLAKIPGSTKK